MYQDGKDLIMYQDLTLYKYRINDLIRTAKEWQKASPPKQKKLKDGAIGGEVQTPGGSPWLDGRMPVVEISLRNYVPGRMAGRRVW